MPHFPAIHISSFNSSNNIWRHVQIMQLFIMQFQFPITFSRKSLNTPPLFQIQSTGFPHSYTPSYIHLRPLKHQANTHTRLYIKSHIFRRQGKYDDVVHITQHSFPLHFLILQSLLLTTPPKYFRSSLTFQNFQHLINQFYVTIYIYSLFVCKSSDQTLPYSFLCSTHQTSN